VKRACTGLAGPPWHRLKSRRADFVAEWERAWRQRLTRPLAPGGTGNGLCAPGFPLTKAPSPKAPANSRFRSRAPDHAQYRTPFSIQRNVTGELAVGFDEFFVPSRGSTSQKLRSPGFLVCIAGRQPDPPATIGILLSSACSAANERFGARRLLFTGDGRSSYARFNIAAVQLFMCVAGHVVRNG